MTETGEITNTVGKNHLGGERLLFKTNFGQENPEWEEQFSTCLAQQILFSKNLLAIHYPGSVSKMFPLTRDVRSTHEGGLTCATEVQSSLLIHPGTWTAHVCVPVSSVPEREHILHRGDKEVMQEQQ